MFSLILMASLAADPPKIVATPVAAPPAGSPVVLDVGKFVWLDVQGAAGPITWAPSANGVVMMYPKVPKGAVTADHFPGIKQGSTAPDWHKRPAASAVPVMGAAEGSVTISAWGVQDGEAVPLASLMIQVGQGPRPPPGPDPKPPGPTPQPVTSFRVFLTFESGQTITSAQSNAMYGSVVEEWLNANCTGGKAGWRRRDRSLGGENDPTMAALWAAIQPKLTTVPAIAIEVNGRVEILPLEATPAKMVELLDKYKKGVK